MSRTSIEDVFADAAAAAARVQLWLPGLLLLPHIEFAPLQGGATAAGAQSLTRAGRWHPQTLEALQVHRDAVSSIAAEAKHVVQYRAFRKPCSGVHTCEIPHNQTAVDAGNTLQVVAVTRKFDRDSTPPSVTIASNKLGYCRRAWLACRSS